MSMRALQAALVRRLEQTGYPVWVVEAVPDGVRLPWLGLQTRLDDGRAGVSVRVWVDNGLPGLFDAVERVLKTVPQEGTSLRWEGGCCWLWTRGWHLLRDAENRAFTAVVFDMEGRVWTGGAAA